MSATEQPQPRQCMGGWCRLRESCAHYWAPQRAWQSPAENLCRELAQVVELDPAQEPGKFHQLGH